jgi:4-carboxymuconolactone decarboxylase
MDKLMIAARSGYDQAAIAAREAEITGKPQRIAPIMESELDTNSLQILLDIRQSAGVPQETPIAEYCLTVVKHPAIFRCQMEMGTAIFFGELPPRERELAILRVGWLLRAPYEWGEHVDISKRCGVTAEEIERVIIGSTASGWGAHDAAILRGVEELLSEQSICDETWGLLSEAWNEQQMIEFTMMVGQYVANALVLNALRIRLERDNPGLTHR